LPVGAFAHAVADAPLYYALTDARRALQSLLTTREVRADDPPPSVVRAGRFGVSPRPDRAVTRYAAMGADAGPIWTLEELENGFLQRAPVFRSFLGGEAVFDLPNGMRGFAIASPDGTPLAELPGCLSGDACATVRARSPVTCIGCHQEGLLDVSDQVGPAAASLLPTYDTETISAFTAQYVSAEALSAVIAEDNERELSAKLSSGDVAYRSNGISSAFFNFEKALSLADAAEELGFGLDSVSLRDVLIARSADPRIAALQPLLDVGGRVERETFSAAYQLLLCATHEGTQNRPVDCPVR
jgi:hypothetical protein